MKIAFLVDKTQTLQVISELLISAARRDHNCTVFSLCSREQVISPLVACGVETDTIECQTLTDRQTLHTAYTEQASQFDAVIGINVMHPSWSGVYTLPSTRVYGLGYCWNAIYKAEDGPPSGAKILTNTEWARDFIISQQPENDGIIFMGSPWFEFLRRFKRQPRENYIIFMAPHNRFFRYSNFNEIGQQVLGHLRRFCDAANLSLILKTRRKFGPQFQDMTVFDGAVYDDQPFDHLILYANARCVLNFCSSAVNEAAILNVPSLFLFPDLYRELRKNEPNVHRAMNAIADRFYSGPIIDGVHCASINAGDYSPNDLFKKLEGLLTSTPTWDDFEKTFFSGDHSGASDRIIEMIEGDVGEHKTPA